MHPCAVHTEKFLQNLLLKNRRRQFFSPPQGGKYPRYSSASYSRAYYATDKLGKPSQVKSSLFYRNIQNAQRKQRKTIQSPCQPYLIASL